ncbi:MAG: PRC-barrel domain-containing protein [Paracoccus sp. (in: a-proteobacteria)]
MKALYLTSALILALGTAALAQDGVPPARSIGDTPASASQMGLVRASVFHDADVYSIDPTGQTAWDDGVVYNTVDANWDRIGQVKDLVLDTNGEIVGAIAEVGGFIGIDEKKVLLRLDEIALVVEPNRISVVSALSKADLENREKVAEDRLKGKVTTTTDSAPAPASSADANDPASDTGSN